MITRAGGSDKGGSGHDPDEEERRRKADELFELALKALERIVSRVVRDALRRAEWGTLPDEYDPAKDPDHPMNRGAGDKPRPRTR